MGFKLPLFYDSGYRNRPGGLSCSALIVAPAGRLFILPAELVHAALALELLDADLGFYGY